MNKKVVINKLKQNGDSVITLRGEPDTGYLVTTDFENAHIRSVKRTERFELKNRVLVFNWTLNKTEAIDCAMIMSIEPLSTILKNEELYNNG